MQTQVRPPRQRSSGGRTLMLLGLVLALAAAAIVFYIASSVQGTIGQTVSVVTAQVTLKAGTILTVNDTTAPDVRIQDVFVVKQYDKKVVPPDAYLFVGQDALNTVLEKKVVKEDILQGEILRNPDPRLADIGTASAFSLTNVNPSALGPGQVLFVMKLDNGDFGVQPGDRVDIIMSGVPVSGPGIPAGSTGSVIYNQKPILVYAVDNPAKGKIVLVVDEVQAVQLAELETKGVTLTLVIRKPGDTTPAPTTAETTG
jgi:hypothetical protein